MTNTISINKPVRTRFAPSPTGYFHIGNARTALFIYLFAKHYNGAFILRIEDTDQERFAPDSLRDIMESLQWLGIDWDEGPLPNSNEQGSRKYKYKGKYTPYIQSERLPIYKTHAQELVEKEGAYYCFCSPERLEELRKNQVAQKMPPMYDGHCRNLTKEEINKKLDQGEKFVIRQKVPREGITAFKDLIRGNIQFENKTIDDSVLLKSDGYPTYHLANVVDDHFMEITHVIRAEEWLPSTPKHILMYQAFGWNLPEFAHLPMVLGPDHSKLSKRHGATAARDYRAQGYLPEAIINFIAFLGWNPGTEEEIFSLEELIKRFSIERVGKAGAVFNIERLDWINGYYIRHSTIEKLTELATPYLEETGLVKKISPDQFESEKGKINISYIQKVISLEQERLKKISDLPAMVDFFFKENLEYDPSLLVWKKSNPEDTKIRLEMLEKYFNTLNESEFDRKILEEKVKNWIEENKLGVGDTLWPMRVALSGKDKSPGPFEIAEILEKSEVIKRIQKGIGKLT